MLKAIRSLEIGLTHLEMPELKEIAPDHEVACFYVENITK